MEQLLGYNCHISITEAIKINCPPEWSWESNSNHWTGLHLWYVLSGGATVLVSGEKYELVPGDGFVFYLDQNHICTHNPTNPLSVYTAHFFLKDEEGNILIPSSEVLPRYTHLHNHIMNVELCEILLVHFRCNETLEQEILFKAILLQLLSKKSPIPYNQIVEDMCLQIINNLNKNYSLVQLSKISGYSTTQLTRLFRQYKGMSPHRFMIKAKLDVAKGLISYSNTSFSDIAQHLGYCDLNHFLKQFKQEIGVSPKKYKNDLGRL